MDKKSFQLPLMDRKIYHCTGGLFAPYQATPVVHANEVKKETPQSVTSWQHYVNRTRFTSISKFKRTKKQKIYIYLIGPFPDFLYEEKGEFNMKLCNILKSFVEVYFPGMSAEFMNKIIDHRQIQCKTRIHTKSRQTQLFLPDINLFLTQHRPKDAFCVCGFSWFDYYPDENLNHILGEGSFHTGTVAFSFGHYSIFKEKEARQREWDNDFVVEPTIEINDTLNKNGQQPEDPNSSFVYVTYGEKEEAENRVSEFEHNCLSSPKSRDSTKSHRKHAISTKLRKISRMTNKSLSFFQGESQGSSLSSSPCGSTGQDFRDLDNESVLSLMTDISMSEIQLRVCEGLCCESCPDDVEDEGDWDTCEDVTEIFPTRELSSSATEYDRLLKTALPAGSEFVLNCNIIRRLLRVVSHELCHVMGMMHCEYYNCTLNASTSILHVDSQSLFLCPICLRKLQLFLKVNLIQRYKHIDGFLTQYNDLDCTCRKEQLDTASSFIECRLKDDLGFVHSLIDFIT